MSPQDDIGGGRFGLAPGTRLNGIFEIERLVAVGGMGEIYRGVAIQTRDPVAIKTLRPEMARDEAALALFRKEASALHNLQHEAIVRYFVFSVDPDLGAPYLAMEFVEGRALSERLKTAPLALAEAAVLLRRLASGLAAAHELGIVHRDVSPDNVILPGDNVARAKIIDFGIARSPLGGGTVIGSGFAGKLNYVAPEQVGLYGGDVTPRADIYSLGLVVAESLLGAPLDMGGTHVEMIEKRRVVPDLGAIDARIRPLLQRMLQPRPQDRPASMAEVAAWPIPGVGDETRRGTLATPAPPSRGSRGFLVGAAVAALVIVLGGGAYVLAPALFGRTAAPPKEASAAPPLLVAPKPAPAAEAARPEPLQARTPSRAAPPAAPASPAPQPKTAAAPAAATAPTAAPTAPAPISPASPPPQPASAPVVPATATAAAPPAQTAPPASAPQVKADAVVAALAPPPAQSPPSPATAPPAPAATPSSAADRIAQFVDDYRGGDCFLVRPSRIGVQSANIEGFGADAAPFRAFDAAFKQANGFEAEIALRQITPAQCPIVSFLSRLGAARAKGLDLAISAYSVHSGDFLSGSVTGALDDVTLLLVSDDGYVHDLAGFAKREGDAITFKFRIEETTSPATKPQLVLALKPSRPLAMLAAVAPTPGDQFVAALGREIQGSGTTLAFAAQFFKLSE
ncbi:MAG TPA: serine/threonine-protein kinase [Hyphomicrobiales bacterium]|nr:serine/threonine-protein kinase [Hyphomicrobiales bacterium]